jgi:RNA polymerase sigma factor (sigma-70 family)
MTQEQLRDFYRRKMGHMLAFAAHSLGEKDAEDVVQDTFRRLLENLDRIDGANPDGFVWRVLRNAIIDVARKRKMRRETPMDDMPANEEPELPPGDAGEHPVEEVCRDILQQAVAKLSAKRLGALVLWLETMGNMGQALTILRETELDATQADYAGRLFQAKERLRMARREHRELFDQLPASTLWRILNAVVREIHAQPAGGMS